MKLYLLFFIGLLFLSCQQPQSPIFYRIANNDMPPEQDIDITFETFDDAWKWVSENIEYKDDKYPHKQIPEETYKLRTGDCEDYALLLSYFAYKLNIDLYVIKILTKTGNYHVINKLDDIYFTPQIYKGYYIEPNIIKKFTYSEAFYDYKILR